MGSDKPADCEHLCEEDKNVGPARTVQTAAYWIGVNEVTNEDYLECEAAGACEPPKVNAAAGRDEYHTSPEFADYPVTFVTWDQAKVYCGWQDARLPTEAEWEFACRAGTRTSRFYGNEDQLLEKYAWFAINSQDHALPAGTLKPNQLGLFDIFGNVEEWCQGRWKSYWESGGRLEDAEDTSVIDKETPRVVRGGSFADGADRIRSASRMHLAAQAGDDRTGFRVLRELN